MNDRGGGLVYHGEQGARNLPEDQRGHIPGAGRGCRRARHPGHRHR
ncbi:MAG: hypothetical protein MZU79_09020 [Anaerotruncus sp.]|nr:hypothetical protein [Anaerotruncus sp.]